MTLQDRLAELVAVRGAGIVADPNEFRAALDDYLTDDEIEPGDRNVLVDAVRLGAVRRLLELLDQGGEPHAAVNEAGAALARERGSDDPARSRRATALLGFALGRLDDAVVRSFDGAAAAASTPPPPPLASPRPAPPPAAPVAPPPAAPIPPPTRVIAAPEPAPAGRGSRRVLLAVTGGVVLLLVVGALGWWFLLRSESPEDGLEEWFAARTCEAAADRMTGPAEETIQAELDAGDGSELCSTFGDYASEYEVTSVDERGDRATVEVEGTQYYDGSNESTADERDFTAVFDLRRVDGEWLVSNLEWTYADE